MSMAKLKTFITESGFFELAIASPSMKGALRAWGFAHDAFAQGLARQTEDTAIVAATMAAPGMVLKRPIGSKGAFRAQAELPKLKGKPARKQPKRNDRTLKTAEVALRKAEAAHDKRLAALNAQRDAVDADITEEEEAWTAQREHLRKAIRKAG